MNTNEFASFCSAFTKAALITGAGILVGTVVVSRLEKSLHEATVKQCATQDWPAHQHAAHVEFCDMYLNGTLPTASVKAGI